MSYRRILIVEDDEDIRNQTVQALEVEGYEVMIAKNGKVALKPLTSLNPGALIQKPFDIGELYSVVELHCGKPPI